MKISILLVDDDEQFRSMLAESLRRAGYELQEAGDGRQGMKLYDDFVPDLIITDLIMPDQEGLEMIQHFHQHHPETKIIAMSGGGRYGNHDNLKIAKSFGALRVLAKPFTRQEILDAITRVLAT